MIQTAEQFFKENSRLRNNEVLKEMSDIMIEFAKMHVQKALKSASENAVMEYEPNWSGDQEDSAYIDRTSILNAYPLKNIK